MKELLNTIIENKGKWILPLLLIAMLNASCKKDESKEDTTKSPPIAIDTAYISTVEFNSLDSLIITADHYHIHKDSATIVLCHQAGWSRGEYLEIAPKLNARGFNCIAIDQRSGGAVNSVKNETAKRASAAGKGTTYNDAKQDIQAAVKWAKDYYGNKIILWGSSYSSSLVLLIAKKEEDVSTVLSFSPGEYLTGVDVANSVTGLDKPAFLTSSKAEASQTQLIFDKITSTNKVQFVPIGNGEHGSRALWENKVDNQEYWKALDAFLASLK